MKKPIHLRIREDLVAKIKSGQIKPFTRIPFEHELMLAYGCSRMTVNKAISSLVQDGLIERRKRAGSFVVPTPMASTLMDIPDIEVEVLSRGEPYHFELLERFPIRWDHLMDTQEQKNIDLELKPNKIQDRYESDSGGSQADILNIKGIHFANNRPLAYEHRFINLTQVPQAIEADFSAQSPGHWLLNHVSWSHVENEIVAESASAEMAKHLWLNKQEACLTLERHTWRDKDPITRVKQTFNAKSYRLRVHFQH